MTDLELSKLATQIRIEVVKAIASKGGGHIGGSLSIADLLAVLYGGVMRYDCARPDWDGRDYLVCSKGHAGPALYATLAIEGFFEKELLRTLNASGTTLPGHCDRLKVKGIDATTGSLGQGLSIAAGIALGLKLQQKKQRVYCITGDGEHAEGQIWEAVIFCAHNKLNNLIQFLDWNKKQIDGTNNEVMALGDIKSKYQSFGWDAMVINGADVGGISRSITEVLKSQSKPMLIVLDSVKGAGVPCIEELENNHCIAFPKSLAEKSLEYLDNLYASLSEANNA
jgi:transketolase